MQRDTPNHLECPFFLVYTFGFKLEFFLTSRLSHQGSHIKALFKRTSLQDSNFLRLNLSSSAEVASAVAAGRTAAK